MKKVNIAGIVLGCFALLGTFMPIAEKGSLYVDLTHLGGAPKLLYALPVYLVVISVLLLNRKLSKPKAWILPGSIAGLLIAILAIVAGLNHLETMSKMVGGLMGSFGNSASDSMNTGSSAGFGGMLMVVAFALSSALPFLTDPKMSKSSITSSDEAESSVQEIRSH